MEQEPRRESFLENWGFNFCVFAGILLGIGLLGLNEAKSPGSAQGVELILKASLVSAITGLSFIGISKVRG